MIGVLRIVPLDARKVGVAILAVVVLGLLVGATTARLSPTVSLAVAVVISLCILVPLRPKTAVFLVVLYAHLQYLLTKVYPVLPEAAVWVDEGMLVLLGLTVIYRISQRHSRQRTPLDLPLLLVVTIWGLSTLGNRVPIVVALLGLRAPLQYIILFYVIIELGFNKRELSLLVYTILALALLQVPFGIDQYFTRGSTSYYYADAVFGTMGYGANNVLGLYLAGILFLFFGLVWFWKRANVGASWAIILGSLALSVMIVLTGSRQALFLLPLAVLWTTARGLKRLSRKYVLLLLLVALSLIATLSLFLANPSSQYDVSLDSMIESQLAVEGNVGGRIGYVGLALDFLNRFAVSPWVGLGPGTFSSSAAVFFEMPLYQRAINQYNAIWISSHSQVATILGEYGYLGLVTFYWLFISSYPVVRQARFALCSDGWWRGTQFGMEGFWFLFVFGSLGASLWEIQFFSVSFWAMLGIMHVYAELARRGTTAP